MWTTFTFILLHLILMFNLMDRARIEILIDIWTKRPKYIVIVLSIQNLALALYNIMYKVQKCDQYWSVNLFPW